MLKCGMQPFVAVRTTVGNKRRTYNVAHATSSSSLAIAKSPVKEYDVFNESESRFLARSMPLGESIQASAPHRRTREDHRTETAEDYVEAIASILGEQDVCRISDLARRFSVSHVTVHRIIARLQSEGLIDTEPYKPLQLTSAGKRLAAKCRRRHEIVYQFLLSIGIDEETAAMDAEGIEHHVSPRTLKRFESMIEKMDANPE